MQNVHALVSRYPESDASLKVIQVALDSYGGEFVCETCVKERGGWHNAPAFIFYQATPAKPEYSNYYAILYSNRGWVITDGAEAVSEIFTAVEADDGEIVYSRWRHDMRYSKDQSTWIDGGRDYAQYPVKAKIHLLKVIDGQFFSVTPCDIEI